MPLAQHDNFILENNGPHKISQQFSKETCNNLLKKLAKGKALGHDNIPNETLEALLSNFHNVLYARHDPRP